MNTESSRVLLSAQTEYRGRVTNPERWPTWQPRCGDVIVCTPMKCGTTWTQTIIAMLLAGSSELPDSIPVLSPWIDSRLGVAEEVRCRLLAQSGRRVVKTHTPANGFPVWEGVTVIAVYRHPLDVFLSSLDHAANRHENADPRMLGPVADALRGYLNASLNTDAWDNNTLATLVEHFRQTVMCGRLTDFALFHYADLSQDHRGSVRRLAEAIGVAVTDMDIDHIVAATKLTAMRTEPEKFVPEAGKGFWVNDRAFFGTGGIHKWIGRFLKEDIDLYKKRVAELVPEPASRDWLENGDINRPGIAGGSNS